MRTTGIFCRPSCRARHALRENVSFYANASEALAAGFRPCKRCQPEKANAQQHRLDKITHACRLLEQETPVTLEALADQVAMSPFHLHRLFKATTGMTPKAWQQAWRARRLRESLAKGESVTTSILNAGFPDSSSYYRKADETLGMTAKQFRHGGENLAVRYALADCELGRCLVAESERGICAILLGDDDATLISELQQMFPAADNAPADLMFQQHVREVIASLNQRDTPLTLPLDIRGTAFQQQVWQALRTIPCGETVSYQQLANAIGKPKAVRDVASACAANKLAIIIPCHRVVRGDGTLSGYRWGVSRKAQPRCAAKLKMRRGNVDLFADAEPWQEPLAAGAVILHRFAFNAAEQLIRDINDVASQSPFRQMVTPGGYTMSVAMTNCGHLGWTSHRQGYLYSPIDPQTNKPWPAMPQSFHNLCQRAATAAGYPDFQPDACLINRYAPGAKLSLHQDKDEPDLRAPIVSVSLGLPAIFQFGGLKRNDPLKRLLLEHGDVVVWGGESRLFYHGIQPLKAGFHPLTTDCRYNLTFRQAGKKE